MRNNASHRGCPGHPFSQITAVVTMTLVIVSCIPAAASPARLEHAGMDSITAERLAREAADSVARAERLAREAADSVARAERLAREAADSVARAERLAREAADSVARAERRAREVADSVARERARLDSIAAERRAQRVADSLAQAAGRSTQLCWGGTDRFTYAECEEAYAYYETIEQSPNVQSVTRLTTFTGDQGQVGRPVVSPGGDLYYAFTEDVAAGEADLWRQPLVGTGRTRITTAPGLDLMPVLDGSTAIVFSSDRAGGWALWRVSAQGGSGLTRIVEPFIDATVWAASVGPDPALIAYAVVAGENSQIWTLNRRTGENSQLGLGAAPDISPDGTRILYMRRNSSTLRWETWQMDVTGGGDTFISGGPDHNEVYPTWSPGGNAILFASDEGTDANGRHNFDIWHMVPGRGTRTQLTTNGSQDDLAAWHDDGRIFFRSNRGGAWNIWYMRTTAELIR